MSLNSKKTIGDLGEKTAVKFLKKNKYKIVETNFSAKTGEIDIICKNKDFIVFVEVKTRKKDSLVNGVFAVNKRKQSHILKTASFYLKLNKIDKQPRFDIIEVVINSDGKYTVVEHYENAFIQGGDYAIF